jgi:hypothetical protein
MSTELIEAIDELVAFVKSFSGPFIPRSQIEGRFLELDRRVYRLAVAANLYQAFPHPEELRRPGERPGVKPLMLVGKTRLPGDWHVDDFEYLPDIGAGGAMTDWFGAMAELREFAASRVRKKDALSLEDESWLTHVDLAEASGLDPEALRKRLDRWRESDRSSDADWKEAANPTRGQPKYLYRVRAIRSLLYP